MKKIIVVLCLLVAIVFLLYNQFKQVQPQNRKAYALYKSESNDSLFYIDYVYTSKSQPEKRFFIGIKNDMKEIDPKEVLYACGSLARVHVMYESNYEYYLDISFFFENCSSDGICAKRVTEYWEKTGRKYQIEEGYGRYSTDSLVLDGIPTCISTFYQN